MSIAATHESKKVAYIFPGQGSQTVGMGRDLYEESPTARQVFDQADEILGFPLTKLCFSGPQEKLLETVNAQPAILTTSMAALAAMAEARGYESPEPPRFVAGHSLGEYTALVAAGSLTFEDALRLVRERGRLMHEAGQVREGGMAAILGLDQALVEQLCQETGAEIANINTDGQIVISGAKQALVEALDLSKAMGARRAVPLVVSGAFHSSLMEPAVPGLVRALGRTQFELPAIPVISNGTGEPLADQAAIHQELQQQICRCVQWSKSIQYMADNGVQTFLEIGPGNVLTGLVKRIAKGAQTFNIDSMASVRGANN